MSAEGPVFTFDMKPCLIWTRAHMPRGYGVRDTMAPGSRYVHRKAYEEANGPIPDSLEIDHLCGDPRCYEPSHLEVVTHAENVHRGRVMRAFCKRMHPRIPENVRMRDGGPRECLRCREVRG